MVSARVEPRCPLFGTCGGCSLQDLSYDEQLTLKRERVVAALTGLSDGLPIEIAGLEEPWRYRNKAELTFSQVDGCLTLGYHAARSFWRVVDLPDCLLMPEAAMRIARDVCERAAHTELSAYQPRTHQGFFRYLIVRSSRLTGQVLICLITSPGSRDVMEQLAEMLMAAHPHLAGVYWGWTDRIADLAQPDDLIHLRGEAYLEDQVGPFRLRLHPLSFLQSATVQAQRMYEWLCGVVESDVLNGQRGKVAWDLYCGLGLVGLYLSRSFQTIYGIEAESRSLELAAQNASFNGVDNIAFRLGRVEDLLADRRFWLQEARPAFIVVDPPRPGLHPRALDSVLAARPLAIAYFSCNVQSLARDLRFLCSHFPRYRLAHLRAFDMFPQTNHVEVATLLLRQ